VVLSYGDGNYKVAYMNVIYNFLIGIFLFETRCCSYAIKKEAMLPIMVTIFRLCYSSKNFFFQNSLLYRKENAHEDSIWSCAWLELKQKDEENGDGKESRYVHNSEFTQNVNSALSWDIYEKRPERNYYATEARSHAYCKIKINTLE
jgi:hypothetical protein